MELAKILEAIRRRQWVIIQAVILVTLVSVIGSFLIFPSYQASSKILIMKAKGGVFELKGLGLSGLSSIIGAGAEVDIQKVLAASRPYIEEVVLKLQLRDEQGNLMKPDKLMPSGFASAMSSKIFPRPAMSVTQYHGTDILQITAISPDPDEAMMMANTLADIMVDQNQVQMRAEYRSARVFLEEQMERVKARYDAALLKMADFKKEEKTLDLEIETKLAAQKMAELLKQKEDTIIDLAQGRARLGRLKEQLAKQGPDFLSGSTLQESPQIEILKRRLTELRLQLAKATAELTENHPQVQALAKQINMAEAELKQEIAVYRSSAPELAALERQIVSLEAHLQGVGADIDRYFKTLGELPDKAFKQASLDMELNVTQKSYSSLLDSLYQIGMAEATTLSEIRTVEQAVRPLSPVSPNKAANSVLGVFVGLMFGVGLAFVLEYLDDTIRTVKDVKKFIPFPLIGAVPRYETKRHPLISAKDPNDPLCESYRRIRNFLTMHETPIRSLLITSAGPEEGKSTTAANLGISIAREGKSVLILDTDLRRPSLHTYFDLPNEIGIADLLQQKASVDKAIQTTHVDGLSVVSSGPPFPDAGRLIESEDMGRLMAALRSQFDAIILDSAPLLVKSDALVLANHVEGLIIVVQSARTTGRAIRGLLEALADANVRPLGLILNGLLVQKGKYLYEQHFFGYRGPELSASETE